MVKFLDGCQKESLEKIVYAFLEDVFKKYLKKHPVKPLHGGKKGTKLTKNSVF